MTANGTESADRVECRCTIWHCMSAAVTLKTLQKDCFAIAATYCTICGESYLSLLKAGMDPAASEVLQHHTVRTKDDSESELLKSVGRTLESYLKQGFPKDKLEIETHTIGKDDLDPQKMLNMAMRV